MAYTYTKNKKSPLSLFDLKRQCVCFISIQSTLLTIYSIMTALASATSLELSPVFLRVLRRRAPVVAFGFTIGLVIGLCLLASEPKYTARAFAEIGYFKSADYAKVVTKSDKEAILINKDIQKLKKLKGIALARSPIDKPNDRRFISIYLNGNNQIELKKQLNLLLDMHTKRIEHLEKAMQRDVGHISVHSNIRQLPFATIVGNTSRNVVTPVLYSTLCGVITLILCLFLEAGTARNNR